MLPIMYILHDVFWVSCVCCLLISVSGGDIIIDIVLKLLDCLIDEITALVAMSRTGSGCTGFSNYSYITYHY